MDTSDAYIKMADCEEIQKLWKPSNWDNVFCKRELVVVVLSGYSTDGGYYGHQTPSRGWRDYYTGSCDDLSKGGYKQWHIWLPRQDQLQAMVKRDNETFFELARRFMEWAGDLPDMYWYDKSLEQHWLAFVLAERYGKYWNGVILGWTAMEVNNEREEKDGSERHSNE